MARITKLININVSDYDKLIKYLSNLIYILPFLQNDKLKIDLLIVLIT